MISFRYARVRQRAKRRSRVLGIQFRWAQPFPRTGCDLLRGSNGNCEAVVDSNYWNTGSDEVLLFVLIRANSWIVPYPEKSDPRNHTNLHKESISKRLIETRESQPGSTRVKRVGV